MDEYQKIPGPFRRETQGPNRNRIIDGAWSSPELEYLAELNWVSKNRSGRWKARNSTAGLVGANAYDADGLNAEGKEMTPTDDPRPLLTLDGRRRVNLGKIARPEDTRYLAHVEADGTIVLTPAVVVSLVVRSQEP
jgi:hypothetical protein